MSYYPEQEQEYEFYADPTTAAPMLGTVDNKMATMTAAPMMATTAPMMTTAAPMKSDRSWNSMKQHFRGQNGRRNTLLTVVVLLLLVCLVWYLYNHPEETSAATNQVKFQRFRFRR